MSKKSTKKSLVKEFYRGDHVIFKGKGKLSGLEGVVIDTDVDLTQEESVAEVLFYEKNDEIEDLCARVMVSNLLRFEPELAYKPIFPYEDSILLNTGWNISLAWKLIKKDRERASVTRKFIENFYEQCLKGTDESIVKTDNGHIHIPFSLIDIDKTKALSDSTDLSVPIIMVRTNKNYFPIDGRHRIYKAYHTNQPIEAYLLTDIEEKIIKL